MGNISVLAALARQMKVSSTSIKRNNFHFVNTDISSVYQQFTQQVLCITLPIPIIVANFNRLVLPSQIWPLVIYSFMIFPSWRSLLVISTVGALSKGAFRGPSIPIPPSFWAFKPVYTEAFKPVSGSLWQSVVVCGTTGPLVDHLVTTSRPLLQPMKISAVLHASLMPLFWRRMMVAVSDDGCYLSPKMQQTFGPGALQSCPTQSCQEVFVCWDIKFKYTTTQIHFRVVHFYF